MTTSQNETQQSIHKKSAENTEIENLVKTIKALQQKANKTFNTM